MARRWASTACVTSSKLTSENELPSGSLKRAKTPPQIGGCSAASDDEAAEPRSEEHTSELQSHHDLVCRLLLEKKKTSNMDSEQDCIKVLAHDLPQDVS